MTTISLEEALKRATKGPLMARQDAIPSRLGNFFDIDSEECHVACLGDGQEFENAQINAALLAHCYNHFDGLVRALKDAVDELDSFGPLRTKDEKYKSILTKASTITLPT